VFLKSDEEIFNSPEFTKKIFRSDYNSVYIFFHSL